MSDDPRDRKRPRHELDEQLLVNHPTLYYDDGNTILKCEKTLFCAHRSILSNHSPVFRALLLPEIAHEKLRGLTLLEIDGERDEIEAFLNAIYNGINIAADFSTLTVENFPLLASIFRAAIGYGVPRMRDDVLTILRRQWPSSLTAHMAAYRAFKEKLQPEISGPNGTRVPNPAYDPRAADEAIVHPASVIAMLRKGKVADKQLLASLFYDLTRRVWQLGPPFSGYHLKSLPPDDIERLVYGSAALRAAHAHMASTFPPVQFPSPAHKQAHDTNHGHGFTSYWTTIVVPRLLHNSRNLQCEPIEDWDSAREITTVTLPRIAGNCPCAQETLQCISRSQEILWNNLATYFNLE